MSDLLKYTDDELALLLRDGSIDAFTEIYSRYWGLLFDSAYKRVRNTALCEEVVQDVFTKLWEKRNALALTAGLSNYLYTAIKYNVIDYYRKQIIRDKFRVVSKASEDFDNSTIESILLNDLKNHIEVLVNQLPDKCRSVYRLSRIEHKSNKEIATLLNISEKTVEGHLTKALTKLRLSMSESLLLLLIVLWK